MHGLMRDPHGKITTFDAPGAGSSSDTGTDVGWCCGFGFSPINPAGAITGYVIDDGWLIRGFLRDPHGRITTFDAPNAGTGFDQGTLPYDITADGMTMGYYLSATDVNHGFLRAPDGTFTEINVPGSGTGFHQGTIPAIINPAGVITGTWLDENTAFHGFLRIPRDEECHRR